MGLVLSVLCNGPGCWLYTVGFLLFLSYHSGPQVMMKCRAATKLWNHYVWQYFADTNHVEAKKWAAKSAMCIFCDKMQHFQGSSKDLRAPCLSLVDDGHWLIFMIDSLLFSISVFSTDLQRIQTPHSLFWDFIADKTIITSWSGGRVQVWIQVRAPDSHLAFTPKGYSRRK